MLRTQEWREWESNPPSRTAPGLQPSWHPSARPLQMVTGRVDLPSPAFQTGAKPLSYATLSGRSGTRTHTPNGHPFLRRVCLPLPPSDREVTSSCDVKERTDPSAGAHGTDATGLAAREDQDLKRRRPLRLVAGGGVMVRVGNLVLRGRHLRVALQRPQLGKAARKIEVAGQRVHAQDVEGSSRGVKIFFSRDVASQDHKADMIRDRDTERGMRYASRNGASRSGR